MYSNARFSKSSNPPRSLLAEFEVGTHRPSFSTFSPHTRINNQKKKQLFNSSMKTTIQFPKPEIYQRNPSIVPFSSFQQPIHKSEYAAVPFTPKAHNTPNPKQAGTVIELTKHSPIAEHVGASHLKYPTTAIGDTLLKQNAILTINNLPSLLNRLKEDIADITKTRNTVSNDKNQTPPKGRKKPNTVVDDVLILDEATVQSINEYQRQLKELSRIKLRINENSLDPITDRDLLALKRIDVIAQTVISIPQKDAFVFTVEAIALIQAEIVRLQSPP